jgi:hypothetical protein
MPKAFMRVPSLWRVFCTDVERSSVLVDLDLWTKNKTGPSQHCPRNVESAARGIEKAPARLK